MTDTQQKRINKLNEFLKKDQTDSFSKFALALEYVNLSELEKARALFEDIQENDPEYVGLYYHLGKLYEKLDEAGLAIITYNKGIEIAEKAGDDHSAAELRQALLELELEN
ncbi:MAG: hypothetical protein WD491_06325 [Balneolales bacterium]